MNRQTYKLTIKHTNKQTNIQKDKKPGQMDI